MLYLLINVDETKTQIRQKAKCQEIHNRNRILCHLQSGYERQSIYRNALQSENVRTGADDYYLQLII